MTRRGKIEWWEGAVYCLLPVLIQLILGGKQLVAVLQGGLINPDSYMRLVRLEAILDAHHPLNVVARDSSGDGTLLHWSHLLDSLLCLLAAPFAVFVAPHEALHWAGILAGPISIGALGLAVAWAAAPFAERRWRWLGASLVALSPAIGPYAIVGVVHHHVPIIGIMVMAAGWAARIVAGITDRHAGWRLGAWVGVGIWLTPEIIPLAMLILGAVWLAWVIEPANARLGIAMRQSGLAFLLVVAATFAVDPPYAGYGAMEIDRLSIVFVGLAVAAAGVAAGTILIDSVVLPPAIRFASAIMVGSTFVSAWLVACPVVLLGSAAVMNEAGWHLIFDHVTEMQPVAGLADAACYLLPGAFAAVAIFLLGLRCRSVLLGYAALCVVGLLIPAALHVRFAAYPAAAAAIILPIIITLTERYAAKGRGEALMPYARLAMIVLFLLSPYVNSLPNLLAGAQAAEPVRQQSCEVSGLAVMLAPYADKVVMADLNDTPELLYRTQVRTVGSLYHRNVAAALRLRAAWRSGPSETVPPELTATQASLLLFCAFSERSALIEDLPSDTLLDRLNRHDVPPWLHEIAIDPASGNRLYRILQ